jgi:hypothetical protein
MKTDSTSDAIAACEAVLREEQQHNRDHNILPHQVALVTQLLDRGVELQSAYEELHAKLADRPFGLMAFFRVLLTTTDLWNPARLLEAREDRDKLQQLNSKISDLAFDLAALLEERSRLGNESAFHTDTHYHVCDVIVEASQPNPLFEWWVKESLAALTSRFDLKYWPTLSAFLTVIGKDALRAEVAPYHAPAEAGTAGRRPSRADFVRALLTNIDENIGEWPGYLPEGFVLTDATLASLANCVLNLSPDDGLMGAEYVKHVRLRERDRVPPATVYPSRKARMA